MASLEETRRRWEVGVERRVCVIGNWKQGAGVAGGVVEKRSSREERRWRENWAGWEGPRRYISR